jgi:hypothetical protein
MITCNIKEARLYFYEMAKIPKGNRCIKCGEIICFQAVRLKIFYKLYRNFENLHLIDTTNGISSETLSLK